MDPAVLVLDVGKTHTKLTLQPLDGGAAQTRARANRRVVHGGRPLLDASGVEAWFLGAAAELAAMAHIVAIVPVGHGAAAALVLDGRIATPVMDYEDEPPAPLAAAYALERDPFEATLSPALPHGLNLGLQFFWQERLAPDVWPARAQALLWPQYWAWRLSGEMASEVTSLGCHTDLWRPYQARFSDLAVRRGWDARLPPLRPAGDALGTVRPALAQALGVAADCPVLCGLHDSNASLHGVRGAAELAGEPFTLVSTGTWFVAMQCGGAPPARFDERRDVLANVDVLGHPTPSARFMGGREYAAIVGEDLRAVGSAQDAERLVRRGAATSPSFVAGSGPFPDARGAVIGAAHTPGERAALAALHLALMSDVSLDLVASQGAIVIEGRFAADAVFPAALARLRPAQPVFRCRGGDGVALGAARLWAPSLAPAPLRPVSPLSVDLTDYADRWRRAATS